MSLRGPVLLSSSRCHPVEVIVNGDVCQVDVPSHPPFFFRFNTHLHAPYRRPVAHGTRLHSANVPGRLFLEVFYMQCSCTVKFLFFIYFYFFT